MFQMLGFFACVALGVVALIYGGIGLWTLLIWRSRSKTPVVIGALLIAFGCGVLYFCYATSPYQVIVK